MRRESLELDEHAAEESSQKVKGRIWSMKAKGTKAS